MYVQLYLYPFTVVYKIEACFRNFAHYFIILRHQLGILCHELNNTVSLLIAERSLLGSGFAFYSNWCHNCQVLFLTQNY